MKIHAAVALALLAFPVCAQQRPQAKPHDMSSMPHGGFMQGGMKHATAKGVKLAVKSEAATHTITLRIGPMDLPANTSHMKMAQPPDLTWTIASAGWLLEYRAKLVDASGAAVPGVMLHHVAFWNENRSDFLCPNKDEHIFGAGGELTDWAPVPGFGYRVEKADRIRIETMMHNPTPTAYPEVYLEVVIPYADEAAPAAVKNLYPAWMDVAGCGSSGYDLPAGPSTKVGRVPVKFDGILLGVGGHMHDYAQELVLEDSRSKDPVAKLVAKTGEKGRLISMPVELFYRKYASTGGYPLRAGDLLTIRASYDNTSGKMLRDGAMGIVVGYFVPRDEAALASLRHEPKASTSAMSHEHPEN
jgi:hypothetical protein